MDKIVEALSKLLPEDQVSEVAEAVKAELESAREGIEKEASNKLEEAYAELSKELKDAEEKGYEGYYEAYEIIQDLRNRLEVQRQEAESQQKEGYEEAYQMLLAEKEKNENLEVEMYEQFNGKLEEMREHFIDKIHNFLEYKGQEIYEQATRDILNDPRMAEHKVTLDKVVESVSCYLSDEDYNSVCNSKLEESQKNIEGLKGQIKILEARSIRLNNDNEKLTEAVRQSQQVLTESTQNEKKERQEKAENVTGRGNSADVAPEQVIGEWSEKVEAEPTKDADTTLVESIDESELKAMQILAGTRESD